MLVFLLHLGRDSLSRQWAEAQCVGMCCVTHTRTDSHPLRSQLLEQRPSSVFLTTGEFTQSDEADEKSAEKVRRERWREGRNEALDEGEEEAEEEESESPRRYQPRGWLMATWLCGVACSGKREGVWGYSRGEGKWLFIWSIGQWWNVRLYREQRFLPGGKTCVHMPAVPSL